MSLPTAAHGWMDEIRSDEAERDKRLDTAKKMIAGFHGVGYKGETEEGFNNPENHAFKMVSSILPVLAYSNPKVTVNSGKQGDAQEWVRALQHGMDRWLELTRYHRLAEKLATDFCFSWAGTLTSVVPRPGFEEAEDPPLWPQIARLSPHQWGWDRLAYSFEEKRYAWHKVIIDHDELIALAERDAELPEDEREGWDVEVVRGMAEGSGHDMNRPTDDMRDGEVVYYEVWDARGKVKDENTGEMGFHGAIYRFAESSTIKAENGYKTGQPRVGREICKPFDYWGPRSGPYTLYGCFTVPDQSWPLSVLMATYAQERELNETARANNENARAYKEFVAADDEEFVDLINSGKHQHAYYHANLMASKAETLRHGGITDQGIAQEARLRDALERNSGLTEAEQGNLSGVTATESAIATSAASKRQSFYIRKFGDGARANLEIVAHFLANNDRITYEVSPEQAAEMGYPDGAMFVGGPEREDDGTIDDLELSIDIRSMGHRSQAEDTQDGMNKMSIVSELANLAMSSPVNVRVLAEQIGQKMGWPDIVDLIDFEMAEEMRAMNMQAMGQGGQPQGQQAYTPASQPKPKLALASIGKSAGRKAFESKPKTQGAA